MYTWWIIAVSSYPEVFTYIASPGLPVVLMKKGWEVHSKEGLAGSVFSWVKRFPISWCSVSPRGLTACPGYSLPSPIHFCLCWERGGADQSSCPECCSPNDPSLSEPALLSLLTGLWVWNSQKQLLPSKWSISSAVFLRFSCFVLFFSGQILFIFL